MPIWIAKTLPKTGQCDETHQVPNENNFNKLYLCTASAQQCSNDSSSPAIYVQGAGDDNDNWSHGLTAYIFWSNRDCLLATSEEQLPLTISNLVTSTKQERYTDPSLYRLGSCPQISITRSYTPNFEDQPPAFLISCTLEVSEITRARYRTRLLHLRCRTGKLGSRDLRMELPQLQHVLESCRLWDFDTHIESDDMSDISVGVALVLLCLYAGPEGKGRNT